MGDRTNAAKQLAVVTAASIMAGSLGLSLIVAAGTYGLAKGITFGVLTVLIVLPVIGTALGLVLIGALLTARDDARKQAEQLKGGG